MAATRPRNDSAVNPPTACQDRLLRWLLWATLLLLALQLAWPPVERWLNRPRPGTQVLQGWLPPPHGLSSSYWLYLPPSYQNDGRKWPLILSLHGSGDRGDDPSKVANGGLPSQLGGELSLDAIVVSPQCAANYAWDPRALTAVLDRLQREFRIDTNRIYAVGYSMGGFGAWRFAQAEPDRMAAIVCLGGVGASADQWPDIPVWAVHGQSDKTISLEFVQYSIAAARKAGAQVQLTVLQGRGHDIENEVVDNPKLIAWLMAQSKSE
jgi:predicted peptidase